MSPKSAHTPNNEKKGEGKIEKKVIIIRRRFARKAVPSDVEGNSDKPVCEPGAYYSSLSDLRKRMEGKSNDKDVSWISTTCLVTPKSSPSGMRAMRLEEKSVIDI